MTLTMLVPDGGCRLCGQPVSRPGVACDSCTAAARPYITRNGQPLTDWELAVLLVRDAPGTPAPAPAFPEPGPAPAGTSRRDEPPLLPLTRPGESTRAVTRS